MAEPTVLWPRITDPSALTGRAGEAGRAGGAGGGGRAGGGGGGAGGVSNLDSSDPAPTGPTRPTRLTRPTCPTQPHPPYPPYLPYLAPRLLGRAGVSQPLPLIRIGILLTSFDAGGTERQMTELIRQLNRDRFSLHVACFRREGPWLARVEATGVPITAFPIGSLKSLRALNQLRAFASWCRRNQLQVL